MQRSSLDLESLDVGEASVLLTLKKRARPSYGKSSIFLMDKRLWRSTGEKGYSVAIFGQSCEISYFLVAGKGVIHRTLTKSFDLTENVIAANVMGVETVLLLYENLEFCFMHLDQFRIRSDAAEKVDIKKLGRLSAMSSIQKSISGSEEGSKGETTPESKDIQIEEIKRDSSIKEEISDNKGVDDQILKIEDQRDLELNFHGSEERDFKRKSHLSQADTQPDSGMRHISNFENYLQTKSQY